MKGKVARSGLPPGAHRPQKVDKNQTSFVFGIPDPLILMLFEQSLCLNTYVKHESGQEKKILT